MHLRPARTLLRLPLSHSRLIHSTRTTPPRLFPTSLVFASAIALGSAFRRPIHTDSAPMAPITQTTVESAVEPPSTHNQVVIIGSGPAGQSFLNSADTRARS